VKHQSEVEAAPSRSAGSSSSPWKPRELLGQLDNDRDKCACPCRKNTHGGGEKPFQTRAKPLAIIVSVRLVWSTDFENKTADEILACADVAIYEAKGSGRNCVRLAKPSGSSKVGEAPPSETVSLTKS
jgi:hypothetical protein